MSEIDGKIHPRKARTVVCLESKCPPATSDTEFLIGTKILESRRGSIPKDNTLDIIIWLIGESPQNRTSGHRG